MRDDGKCPECGKGIGHFMTCSQHPDHAQFDQMAEIRLEMTCGPEGADEPQAWAVRRHRVLGSPLPVTAGMKP